MTDRRIEVDGNPATAEDLADPALVNYGHVTYMQVRGGGARGLELHLNRLAGATVELFDMELDAEWVRYCVRHALGGDMDASVRVSVFQPVPGDEPAVMVTVRAPETMPDAPQRLKSVPYQRPAAHLKHVGSFAQTYFARRVAKEGYDDALLTGPEGIIAETSIANIGFVEPGGMVLWPAAPMLAGITMLLVDRALTEAGAPARRRPVRVRDVRVFQGAFVTNSLGIAPVNGIDEYPLGVDRGSLMLLREMYEAVPFDRI